METESSPFIVSVPPEQIRKEKEKAAQLRGSQWWKRQTARGVCYYCHRKFPPAELTMDHMVALIRGGKSSRGNVAPACRECNSRKKYLLPLEWEEYLGRISGQSAPQREGPGATAADDLSRARSDQPPGVPEPQG